jgi:plasmid maintenance system antidote protein VapI
VKKVTVQLRIKRFIDENGMKLNFVASKVDIPEKRFYRLMNNNGKLTADEYEKICTGLGVEASFFLDNASH